MRLTPKVGDMFIARLRRIPGFDGPFEVTKVGRKFFYLDVGLKIQIEDGKCTRQGITVEPYDGKIHGAIFEASALAQWWNNLEGFTLSVNKLRAMKAAYDSVAKFEGNDES